MKERVQASIDKLGYVPSIAAQRMSGSRSYLILAINDRERTIADWQGRQGVDWVDQMLLGGMLKCAEYGYRMIFELVDTHNDHVERELRAAIAALQPRSEEHTSELKSLMRISYAVFCLQKKNKKKHQYAHK